ncbi:MAG TPA: iron-containing alcohol dehydrogenase [bacterium]|jgi:alcohol dehydrogenase YqhD (iron-dependent ADH family)|nr:iron-containing alcohol dehydrogenase [bacterium]
MQPFVFHFNTKIHFGSGKLAETGAEAKRMGSKPLVLTGRGSMRATGTLDKVLGLLKGAGLTYALFEKVEPNPRSATLDESVAYALSEGCDFVVALGGGSAMDAAKAVAAALGHARATGERLSVWEWTSGALERRRKVVSPAPTLLISSTAATGSEGNCAAVITKWETHEKAVLWDLGAFPTVSIVDPELMLSLPLEVTRDGCVDMMLHVLEQDFNGDDKAPVQDRQAQGMCLGVMECLERVENDPRDLVARENLSWASVAALLAGGGPNFGRTGNFTVHHLAHPLGGYTDIAHGLSLALLWPEYLRLIMPKREAKIARMGLALWQVPGGPSAGEKTVAALEAWLKAHAYTRRLKDVGVSRDMIPKIAADAVRLSGGGRSFLDAPLPLNAEKCEALYRAAY